MTTADLHDDTVFKALSDATRRRALDLLRAGPMTTGELCARLERHRHRAASPTLGRTGVLRHLAVLMDAGLIVTRTQGRVRWNHFNPAPLQRVCDRWMSRHVQMFASAFSRLKSIAESDDAAEAPAALDGVATPAHPTPARSGVSAPKRSRPIRGRAAIPSAPHHTRKGHPHV